MYIFKSEALVGGTIAVALITAGMGLAYEHFDRNLYDLERRLDGVALEGVNQGVARVIYVDCRARELRASMHPLLGRDAERLCAEETIEIMGKGHSEVVWRLFLADIGEYPDTGKEAPFGRSLAKLTE